MLLFFFFKQKTAYEMRISDWSSDVCSSDLADYYQDVTERLSREIAGSFYVNQFANPANPLAHEIGTGPEIWAQMNHMLDAVVVGVGSGGTLTGLSRYFARVAPHVEMLLADPLGSVLTDVVRSEEHTSELQSLMRISYAVFCLKQKK